jgi:hypothetical protein
MLLIATAALVAAAPAPAQGGAVAQARATVRILSAAKVRMGEEQADPGLPQARQTTVRTGAGPQPAKLIEFE